MKRRRVLISPVVTFLALSTQLATRAGADQGAYAPGSDVIVVVVSGVESERVRARASSALAGSGRRPVAAHEVGLAEPDLAACAAAGEGCKQALARSSAGRAFVVRSEGSPEELVLTARLLDGLTGEELAADRRFCAPCSAPDALEKAVAELVAALVRADPARQSAGRSGVDVATIPGEAVVEIDGRPLGLSGQVFEVAPGEVEIVVKKAGYLEARRQLTIRDGRTEGVLIELEPAPSPPSLVARAAPWASLAAGAGFAVTGVVLIAMDGKSASNGEQLPERRETLAAGIVTTGIGAGLLATSALLFWRARERPSPRAAVVPTGNGIAVFGRF